jgi:chorismate-pyruvate lyase
VNTPRPSTPDLQTLLDLFYPDSDQLGKFQEVSSDQLPAAYSTLLDHNEHMTVTVEAFHESLVDVQVLGAQIDKNHYSRQILLVCQTNKKVVQFGIVRLCFDFLDADIQAEIESQQVPLGRILIEHDVLRQVQLATLWKIEAGPDLSAQLQVPQGTETFGRTALIYCNGEPAVELLEIMTVVKSGTRD